MATCAKHGEWSWARQRERENPYRCCRRCNKALGGYLLNQLQSIELGDGTSLGALTSQSGCGILPRPEDSIIQVGWWCWQRLWTCPWNSEWEVAIQEMKQRLGSETRKYQEGRRGGERAGCAERWALAKVSWGVREPLRERSWLVPGCWAPRACGHRAGWVSCIDTLRAHPGLTEWISRPLFSSTFDLWPIYSKSKN